LFNFSFSFSRFLNFRSRVWLSTGKGGSRTMKCRGNKEKVKFSKQDCSICFEPYVRYLEETQRHFDWQQRFSKESLIY